MSVVSKFQRLIAWSLGGLLVLPWISSSVSQPALALMPWFVVLMLGLAIWLFDYRINQRLVVISWMVAAGITAMMGLLQYFLLADGLAPWLDQPSPGMAFGNLHQRNQFATLTSIGLVALISWISWQSRETPLPWWVKYFALLLALGNAASNSRTGLLQWFFIVLLTAWWFYPRRWRILAFTLKTAAVYLIAIYTLPWMLEVATGITFKGLLGRLSEDLACKSRLVLWSNVLSLIAHKPWLGWGWGELKYAHFVTLFPDARFCGGILGNAHNLPLHLAVTMGIPFALVVCGGFTGWVLSRRPWRETQPDRQVAWGVLAMILLHSLFEYPLWYGPFQLAFVLCLWMLLRRKNEELELRIPRNHKFLLAAKLSIAIAVMVGLAYVALEYYRVRQIYLIPSIRSASYHNDSFAKFRNSWLFPSQIRFAELSLTPLTKDNAQWTHDSAAATLHYSPEPMVIKKLIESSILLGLDEDVPMLLVRYQAAFPSDYARWMNRSRILPRPAEQQKSGSDAN